MFTRLREAKPLCGGAMIFGILAVIFGAVFMLAPKHGIAVVAAFSMIGGIASALLSLAFGIAAYVLKGWKSPSD